MNQPVRVCARLFVSRPASRARRAPCLLSFSCLSCLSCFSWLAAAAIRHCYRSRCAFSLANASSHCPAIAASARRASSTRDGLSAHTCSRPSRRLSTRPAEARTCRCLVTACREMSPQLADSTVIDAGPPVDSCFTSASRVSSPSAAKSTAAVASERSARRFGMPLQPAEHVAPALAVVVEHLGPALERDLVEPGLRKRQPRAAARRLQDEGDRRPCLARVVNRRIHFPRMPLPYQPARRRQLDKPDTETLPLVSSVRRRHLHLAAGGNRPLDGHLEPRRQLRRVGERAPHPRRRRGNLDRPVDPPDLQHRHLQPPGCRLAQAVSYCNQSVARRQSPRSCGEPRRPRRTPRPRRKPC